MKEILRFCKSSIESPSNKRLLSSIKKMGNLPSTISMRLMHPALCIAWRVCDNASAKAGFFSFNFSYSSKSNIRRKNKLLFYVYKYN